MMLCTLVYQVVILWTDLLTSIIRVKGEDGGSWFLENVGIFYQTTWHHSSTGSSYLQLLVW
jgi:hypothetical protein